MTLLATPEPFSEARALPMVSPDYARHFQPKKVRLEALAASLTSDQCFVFSRLYYCTFSTAGLYCNALHFQTPDFIAHFQVRDLIAHFQMRDLNCTSSDT
jgi:hypothetical protein